MRERESFLRRMEERMSRLAGWLAQRYHVDQPGANEPQAPTDALRRELVQALRSIDAKAHEDLARARATVEDMGSDYGVPPPRYALQPEEAKAFQRYLETVARLEPIISNLDDPRWDAAHEEYERAWAEMERAFEAEGDAASPP